MTDQIPDRPDDSREPVRSGEQPTSAPSKRVCPTCGAANPPDATDCVACGEALPTDEETAVDAVPEAEEPVAAERSPWKVYLLAGLGVLVLAVGAFFLTADFTKAPPGAVADNLPAGHPPVPGMGDVSPEVKQHITELEKQVAEHPDNPDLQLQLANALYDARRHSEAVPHYQAYLKTHDTDAAARTDMATSMGEAGDLDGAIIELRKVLDKDPDEQNAAYNLAVMYYNKKMPDSLIYWLRQTVAIDSTTRQGSQANTILSALDSAHTHGEMEP